MHIGTILRHQQPNILEALHKEDNYKHTKHKKQRHRRGEKEHLSFSNYKSMMEEGHVYKRTKGGAYRQVR